MTLDPLRIGIVGGSIGGLTTGVLLHELGHDVQIFERSKAALEGRGAGIVALPMTERYFREQQVRDVAMTLTNWSYVDAAGSIIDTAETNYRFTSWNTIYRALLDSLPDERYHLAHEVSAVGQRGADVTISFVHGGEYRCDLLVGADGLSSTVRSIVSPDTSTDYSGYVAWRGTVLERDLAAASASLFEDAIVYQVLDHGHILAYPIPGPDGSVVRGERFVNFVWYRNVSETAFDELMTDRLGSRRPGTMPPGFVQDRFLAELQRDAGRELAPQLAEVVIDTRQPFIQAIFDMAAERFVHGRIALLGDAATALRPHVAAGTAKACADGWALRDHLAGGGDLDESLAAWERGQLELARSVAARSRRMGESAQVESTMVPGDPGWRFGLFGPEDRAM